MKRRQFGCAALGAIAASTGLLPRAAGAQGTYPDRTVTLVVSWAPGGSTDFVGRLLAQQMSKELGQTMVVENRAGASGTIGHLYVARARPDGYTLLMGVNSTYAMATHLFPQKGYDDAKSFTPVGRIAETPIFLCVRPQLGVKTVQELVARAKAQPGKMSYASSGAGSSAHLATELFLKMAGIDVLNVTYRGGAPAVQALLAGEVQMAFVDAVTALPLMQSKEAIGIGVSSLQRNPLTPEIPTIAESGLPGFECSSQFALLAPAGTPEPVVQRLHTALVAALKDEGVLQRLRQASNFPTVGSPAEFPAYLAAESAKWGDVIRTRGISAE
ncbi:MAG: twin-arginine translocation pathway signal protein [Roseomonas sp.]|nr:twin-arginine translocation pathway signal protein [Roseomonas sp.]